VIAAGIFVQAPVEDGCKWCKFGAACGEQPPERTRSKLADPELAPYIRLTQHE
jgi:hypothetical protein